MPCSRSRTMAAPERMIASMVTLLMIPMTLVNHAVVTFGLKTTRTARLTGGGWAPPARDRKSGDLVHDDLLRISRAESALHHNGRIDIELNCGVTAAEHVALEVRRDIHHECEFARVHRRNDIAFGNRPRTLEVRRQKCARDPPRQFGLILIDQRDCGIVHLLRVAVRLSHDL